MVDIDNGIWQGEEVRVEIVAIGNEVLAGFTINSNGAFIAQEVEKIGFYVIQQTVLPDEPEALAKGFVSAMERADVVIATGGLGPTFDDDTRRITAELFGKDFYYDEDIAEDIRRRFGNDQLSIRDQATIPCDVTVLKNSVGTAPGLVFTRDDKRLILLPGVPIEMQAMLIEEAIPYLQREFAISEIMYRRSINLCLIPEIKVDPFLRHLQEEYPKVAFGIYPSHGTLIIRCTSKDPLDSVVGAIVDRFKENVFPAESGKIEDAVHDLFIEKKLKLSLAESCTGGAIAACLTQRSGASEYFLGSIVSYSNDVKNGVLGVDNSILEEYGAVSKEVVQMMAAGALKLTGSDHAIAVSGIAGPDGGTEDKPVGTVWACIKGKNNFESEWVFHAKGNRQAVIKTTINNVLSHLWKIVSD